MEINYITGDATEPQGEGMKMIIHICNSLGAWGSGFVVPLGEKYPLAKERYLDLKNDPDGYILGETQIVPVQEDIIVANMIAQFTIGGRQNKIDYVALGNCLRSVRQAAKTFNASIHAPRFGAGLAGAPWSDMEEAIYSILIIENIPVTIYDLPKGE
jgi:O-acetyl-ADP-ribose deacetylase (regulator of RNase III)